MKILSLEVNQTVDMLSDLNLAQGDLIAIS